MRREACDDLVPGGPGKLLIKLGHVTVRAASPERLSLRLSELPSFFHRPDFCLAAALAPSASARA